ncbi:MAG: hypothetical protein Q8M53_11005 [Burkholderiales bacterium]|nr:hypothetical protein [Burkholderiales bacterium]
MSEQLTPAQRAHAENMRAAVHKHCPDLLPQIRELTQLGLIDGWRNVTGVLVEGPPRPRKLVNVAVALENSLALKMTRGKP